MNSTPQQKLSYTETEYQTIVVACRTLPPATGSYRINDYVENVLLTVVDFMLKTPVVVKAQQHYIQTAWTAVRTHDDLISLLAQYPDDKTGNLALAQYLWGYNLWTRAQMLRRLVEYLEGQDVTDQASLQAWALQADFQKDFAGKVKGLGFAVFKWLVMRQGVETIKPDVHVHRYVETILGRTVSDRTAVEILERAAKDIGIKVYEMDWAIWELGQRGASIPPAVVEIP